MNDARHDPEEDTLMVDFDAAAALHWEAERRRSLGAWMDDVQARLAALEARELTVGDLLATVGGAPDDDLRNWAAPPGALAGRPGGTMTLEFRHAPQPIGAPEQPPRDRSTWTKRVDGRLVALEGEVATLRSAVNIIADAMVAIAQALASRGDDGR